MRIWDRGTPDSTSATNRPTRQDVLPDPAPATTFAHLDATLGAGIDLYVAGLVHHRHEAGELEERASASIPKTPNEVPSPYRPGDVAAWLRQDTTSCISFLHLQRC